jgi:hypothetical protein
VLVVMDQFTRRLVGIGVHCCAVTGADLCCMFNAATHGQGAPRHLSTDHDPLFEAHRWTGNLRILEIDEIKTVPNVPLSHPFVERVIGTMRREFLDQVLFWNARDLERKLAEFQALLRRGTLPRVIAGSHTLDLCQWPHGDRCRSEPRALGLSLQGPRPPPSRRQTANSRRTAAHSVARLGIASCVGDDLSSRGMIRCFDASDSKFKARVTVVNELEEFISWLKRARR